MTRVVGADALVHGTDRPYAGPTDLALGPAFDHAVHVANPHHFLNGRHPMTLTAPNPGPAPDPDVSGVLLPDQLPALPGRVMAADELLAWVRELAARPELWEQHVAPPRAEPPEAGTTSRCTATPTSTSGCSAGTSRTTPAGTTTTCPPAPSR